jgi:hypothetical protein
MKTANQAPVEDRRMKPAIDYQNGRKILKATNDGRSLTAADIFRGETFNID